MFISNIKPFFKSIWILTLILVPILIFFTPPIVVSNTCTIIKKYSVVEQINKDQQVLQNKVICKDVKTGQLDDKELNDVDAFKYKVGQIITFSHKEMGAYVGLMIAYLFISLIIGFIMS